MNVKRALQQFSPGESDFDAGPVPSIGWDYGFTDGFDTIRKYSLLNQIPANQFVSITLAWDREVFLNDDDFDNEYDAGETFITGTQPVDLNLYLVPAGSTTIANAIASSIAANTSVEHIFHQVQQAGQYEIWVEQASGGLSEIIGYGLAWWTETFIDNVVIGDYSGNGTVGPEDYGVWKSSYGDTVSPGTGADGNGDGIVDAADYTVWRNNLSAGSGGLAAVPEPSTLCLLGTAILSVRMRGRRRRPEFSGRSG